jgi:hypothetical protein
MKSKTIPCVWTMIAVLAFTTSINHVISRTHESSAEPTTVYMVIAQIAQSLGKSSWSKMQGRLGRVCQDLNHPTRRHHHRQILRERRLGEKLMEAAARGTQSTLKFRVSNVISILGAVRWAPPNSAGSGDNFITWPALSVSYTL